MHIAYVTTYDSSDVSNWSGLGQYIHNALCDQGISSTQICSPPTRFLYPYVIKAKICRRIFKRLHLFEREPTVLKSCARQVKKKLFNSEADIVFSLGTIPIAHLQCKQPIVFWTDSTFAGMIDFYTEFSNLCKNTIRNGNAWRNRP